MNRTLRIALALVALALFTAPTTALASHFRGGTITWTRPSGSQTVSFVITHSWRVSPGVNLIYGDGGTSGGLGNTLLGSFTDSTGSSYSAYRSTTSRTYSGSGPYTAYFNNCCRINNLQNAAGASFTVQAVVSFAGGNTANPAIGAPALLQMVRGATNTQSMSVVDPDNNATSTCRFATLSEAGVSSSSASFAPSWLSVSPSCVLTGNPPSGAGTLWAYAVRITDNNGSVNTFDGMIELVSGSPPSCTGGGNFNVAVGQPFTTSFVGSNPTGGNLTMQLLSGPSGATFSPTSGASPVTSTFNWTPGTQDFGQTYAATVLVQNSQNLTATCPLGLTVPLNQPPVVTTTGPYQGTNGVPTPVNGSATDNDGTIVSYEWDCNNDGSYETGLQATAAAVCPAITTSGTYTIRLRATDDGGGTGTATTTILIPSLPPVANAGGPYTGNIGIPVALTANGSSDPDGTIVSYEWDCNSDGTYDMTTTSVTGGQCTFGASGNYTVTLRVTDNTGASATDTATVVINMDPVADAGGPYTPNVGTSQALNGSGSSDPDGLIVLYEWDCTNDGTYDSVSVSATNATCTWPTPGLFTIRLRVTDDDGATAEDTANVAVNGPPVADAGGPYTLTQTFTATVDGSGSFDADGTIVLYEWDCNSDGTLDIVGTGATGACTYPTAGNYTVTLTVTDNQGLTATSSDVVSVQNSGPVADAGGPYNVGQGQVFTLNGSGSSDPDGTIVSYEWDCDGNGTFEFTNPIPNATNCSFADEGTYTVTLRVTDNSGATSVDSATVNVGNAAPVADADNITGGPYFGTKNFPIQVNGSASFDPDGTLVLYEWDCESDGIIDVVSTLSVGSTCTFPAVGTYTVTLQVTDDDGLTDTDTAIINVGNDAPTADAGGPYTGVEGVPVPLDASLAADPGGAIVSYAWDCNTDGVVDITVTTPTAGACTYQDQGTYTITLLVTDDDGLTDSISTTVAITNVAPAINSVVVPSGDEGVALSFTASASDAAGDPLVYTWNFGDGTTGTGSAVTHTYADDAVYTVTLTVTDGDGGSTVSTQTSTIANVAPFFGLTNPSFAGDEGEVLPFVVTVGDQGPADVPDLVVTWDWGDGSPTETGVNVSHAFPDDDTYFVVAVVDDQDGGTDTLLVEVTTANVAPIITSNAPINAVEGSLYTYQPIVVDPGTEVFSWTMSPSAPAGMTIDPSTGLIQWTPTMAELAVGSYTVVITVNDGDGGTDAQSWTIQIFAADSDGDGMPDDWEIDNGLNPNNPNDAGQDPDQDGATNLEEFGQGTDPFSYDGPTIPVLISPIGGVTVASDRPELLLENATDPQGEALTYVYEVYADAALSTLVTSVSGVIEGSSQTEWKVDVPLQENTDYWWRAAAEDQFTVGTFALDETFFVNAIDEAPTMPVLVYPIGGETAASTSPTLLWTEGTDPDRDVLSYDVEIYNEDGDLVASTTAVFGDGTDAEWTVDVTLNENAWFTWAVRSVDDDGMVSDWTEFETFFVSADNQSPIGTAFIYPIDGISIDEVSPELLASEAEDPEGGAVEYFFEIDRDSSFTSAAYESLTVPHNGSGEVAWDLADFGIELPEDRWAFARVRAIDEAGVSSVPDTITFFVRGSNGAPTVPVLFMPANGATGPARPTLVVEDPTDPEGDVVFIEFLVAAEQDLENMITRFDGALSGQNEDGLTRWAVDVDLADEVFWTARAIDENGAASDWAEPWRYRAPEGGIGSGDGDAFTGGAGGCDCAEAGSSVVGSGSSAWALLLLPLLGLVRRRR
jgi:PKD repeat protein